MASYYAPNFEELEGHIAFGLFVRLSVCLSVCLSVHARTPAPCVRRGQNRDNLAATSGNEISLHFRATVIADSPQACRSPSLGLLCLLTCFSIKVNEINESYTLCQVRDKHTVGAVFHKHTFLVHSKRVRC